MKTDYKKVFEDLTENLQDIILDILYDIERLEIENFELKTKNKELEKRLEKGDK